MKKFEFNKSYEEVEIAGKVYQIEMSDEKVQEYYKDFVRFYEEAEQQKAIDVENMTEEEKMEQFKKSQNLIKQIIDKLLGEGSFDELYEKSGHSTVHMIDLLDFLSGILGEKAKEIKQQNMKRYVNNQS